MDLTAITRQTQAAAEELLAAAALKPGELFVIGCSTSAVAGYQIGTQSSEDIARAVMDGLRPGLGGVFLAVQCCEHLNRALVVERAALERFRLEEVCVRPHLHAGGAMAVQALAGFEEPVVVESLHAQASAGMDIGGTFIGMHLKPVAVPIHSGLKRIGDAVLLMARTRPKYIGGPRAQYEAVKAH